MLPLIYADKGNTVEILKVGGSAEVKKSINPLPRNFQYLDKYGKRILMQAREMDVYKQKFLHKNIEKKKFCIK